MFGPEIKEEFLDLDKGPKVFVGEYQAKIISWSEAAPGGAKLKLQIAEGQFEGEKLTLWILSQESLAHLLKVTKVKFAQGESVRTILTRLIGTTLTVNVGWMQNYSTGQTVLRTTPQEQQP